MSPTAPSTAAESPQRARSRSESRRRAWGLTGLLVTLYVLSSADKAVFGLITVPLREELHLSATQIGMTGSIFFLAYSLGGFLAGPLNRMLTLKWAIALIAILWSVVLLPLIVWATFVALLISRTLLGMAEGPASALQHTAAYSWHAPAKRGLPGAMITSGTTIAKIVVVPALAFVMHAYGWRATVLVLAAASALWVAPWLLTWRPGPYLGVGKPGADQGTAEPAVPWRRIVLSRTFLGGLLAVIPAYMLISVVLQWLPSYFEKGLGYSQLQSGWMFAFPSFVGFAALIGGSFLSDRAVARGRSVRAVRVVAPAIGIMIAGGLLLALPAIPSRMLTVTAISLAYGLTIAVFPLFTATMSEICPPRQLAGTLGTFLAMQSIGGVVGPLATGIILDAAATPVAGYQLAFQLIGAASAVLALLAVVIADPAKDHSRNRQAVGPS
ncbi:MFS transporter [Rhodococcus opacus]|uniref:MFS transporter n=1 Tax=Rhodococcus opacus TaxID=37919 RepID=UPI001C477F18|nr:MFS transporter [Rhodococcus opacus]